MNGIWQIVILAMTLLVSGAVAGFIQSPIPPSTRENFLQDRDGDGRLDNISIKFLGNISKDYMSLMMDSLTLDWADTTNERIHVSVAKNKFAKNSGSARRVDIDLRDWQKQLLPLTAVNSMMHPAGSLGNVNLYLSDGTVYKVPVLDKMAPVIVDAQLRSYRGRGTDSLMLNFSEPVKPVAGCEALLEYKSASDLRTRVLPMTAVEWNFGATAALFTFDADMKMEKRLTPRDSVRLLEKCVSDSLENLVSASARFLPIVGFYPIELHSTSMVDMPMEAMDEAPIFQLLFEDAEADVPNASAWGVAMDVLGPEFENAIRDAVGLKEREPLNLSKLKIQYSMRVYTNLGAFVVGTSAEIQGDDSRFKNAETRLFLKWNLMSGKRRRVAVGAYIANIIVMVSYDGTVVFRNDVHHGPTTLVFGVRRHQ